MDMSDLFSFGLPHAREMSKLDASLRSRLEDDLHSASSQVTSFTNKLIKKHRSIRDAKLEDAKMMLDAVTDDLNREMQRLGRKAKLQTKDDFAKFEDARRNVQSLWTEYQQTVNMIVDRVNKLKSRGQSSRGQSHDQSHDQSRRH